MAKAGLKPMAGIGEKFGNDLAFLNCINDYLVLS